MAKFDFFISYSSKDNETAIKIVNALESAGLRCWIAPRNIPYGTPYARAIMEGIDECEKFIVLITKNSIESDDVLNEVDNAHSLKKTLIPIRLTDVSLSRELNYYLSRTQWLTIPSDKPEEILKLLNIETAVPPTVDNSFKIQPNNYLNTKKTNIYIFAAIAVVGIISFIGYQLSNDHLKEKNSSVITREDTSEETRHTIPDSMDIDKTPITHPASGQSTTVEKKEDYPSNNEKHDPQSSVSYEKMLTDANTFYNHEEYDKALPLYETIANGYDINYADKVGYMYYHGIGTAKSPSKAIEWCKKAADNGNHAAQIRVGYMSLRAEEYTEAARYYLEAEKHVILNHESKNDLGYLYFNGYGVTKDLDKAKKYWMEAASAGHSTAKSNMEKYFKDYILTD